MTDSDNSKRNTGAAMPKTTIHTLVEAANDASYKNYCKGRAA